ARWSLTATTIRGFPCCVWSPMLTCRRPYPGRFSGACSLTLRPARSPGRLATLYTESSDGFVAFTAASVVTGWTSPGPGRELHPLKSSAFHGALLLQLRNWKPLSVPTRLAHHFEEQGRLLLTLRIVHTMQNPVATLDVEQAISRPFKALLTIDYQPLKWPI